MKSSVVVILALAAPSLAGCAGFGLRRAAPAEPAATAAAARCRLHSRSLLSPRYRRTAAAGGALRRGFGPAVARRVRLGATAAADRCGRRAAGAVASPGHSVRRGARGRPRRADRRVADGGRSAGRLERADRGARFRTKPLVARRARRLRFCRARGRDRRRLPRLFADDLRRRTAQARPGRRLQAAGRDLEDDELEFCRDLGRVLR